jgi:uncharacterized SAM-binding protein YcdF (DUF218 family)
MPTARKLLLALFVVLAAGFAIDLAVVVGFSVYHPTIAKTDAVIVLGAKVGTPALKFRSLKGLEDARLSKSSQIVLSGGQGPGEPVSEAKAMKQVIDQAGVGTSEQGSLTVLLDEQSYNTYQNIHNSKKLVPGAHSVLIVSDCFHLARAVVVAKRAGFEYIYWDAPRPDYYQPLPLGAAYLREVVAMIAYLPKFIAG